MSPIEHKLRPVYTPHEGQSFTLQMYFLHLMHVYCVFLSFLGPHTHHSASCCCYRLQSRMMKKLSSGILLTYHSLTYIVTTGHGTRVRHTHKHNIIITHTYFRYWSLLLCSFPLFQFGFNAILMTNAFNAEMSKKWPA